MKFKNRFKYLGTYLAQDLSDDTDINERINTASKNFNALGKELFRNPQLSLHILCCLYVVTTTNILLWGYNTWTLTSFKINILPLYLTNDRNHNASSCERYEIKNDYLINQIKISRNTWTPPISPYR